jgi:hypothetical protein
MMRESQPEVLAGNRMLWDMWVVFFDVMSILLRATGIGVIISLCSVVCCCVSRL